MPKAKKPAARKPAARKPAAPALNAFDHAPAAPVAVAAPAPAPRAFHVSNSVAAIAVGLIVGVLFTGAVLRPQQSAPAAVTVPIDYARITESVRAAFAAPAPAPVVAKPAPAPAPAPAPVKRKAVRHAPAAPAARLVYIAAPHCGCGI